MQILVGLCAAPRIPQRVLLFIHRTKRRVNCLICFIPAIQSFDRLVIRLDFFSEANGFGAYFVNGFPRTDTDSGKQCCPVNRAFFRPYCFNLVSVNVSLNLPSERRTRDAAGFDSFNRNV